MYLRLAMTPASASSARLWGHAASLVIGKMGSADVLAKKIATRYDKTARSFLGALYLADAVVWLD